MSKENIVFGGISCRLPESDSPDEFWENLINAKDMTSVERERWPNGIFSTPKRFGKVKTPDYFDSQFFEISARQAEKLDPMTRLMLEVCYEAILDAGYNPLELRNSNTGVFMGCMGSEAAGTYVADANRLTGYEAAGISLAMLSNRISYFFDFNGPSMTIDTACSSSIFALSAGIDAIITGRCDFALIGGANLIFTPNLSISMTKFQMLSPEGESKVFDKSADGYVRSDGIVATLITREHLARRNYSRILNCVTNNDGYNREGVTFPNKQAQVSLLRKAYNDIGIDTTKIKYYEAHGTGTPAGDPQEVAAIDEVLGQNRNKKNPLLIGSVKSNIGHTEGAAGLASVLKILLAMYHGEIPPNINFSEPNPEMKGILEGRLKVVLERTPWKGGLVGISSFGFGGANAHLVLEGQAKSHKEIPELTQGYSIAPCSFRTEDGLDTFLEYLENIRCRNDIASFLQPLASTQLNKMNNRAVIYRTENNQCRIIRGKTPLKKPSLCYVFNGIGAQWTGMASDLINVPVFRRSINLCNNALEHTELNLIELLSDCDERAFENTVNTFPCLTAIQIALVDILNLAGLKPDFLIGHSVGEIACAYADGKLTREQAMRVSYWRGRSMLETKVKAGAMAYVGLNLFETEKICPKDVVVACHNGENNVTVSGEKKAISRFVKKLETKNIEAKVIRSTRKAFHSHMVSPAAEKFHSKLGEIIPKPLERSKRWICTSRPEREWHRARYCSANYFKNNLLNPVYFHEGIKYIPNGSIVIEIGAHALFRGILIESLNNITHISFMQRNSNNIVNLFDGLSHCYVSGLDMNYENLVNNKPSFKSLPRIPNLMAWDHHKTWPVPKIAEERVQFTFDIDVKEEEYNFLSDHRLNGKIVFPAVGYLYLTWKAASLNLQVPQETLPVQFEDVKLHRASMIRSDEKFEFNVSYLKESQMFEVKEKDTLLASGKLKIGDDIRWPDTVEQKYRNEYEIILSKDDIYQEFRLRGYDYGPKFQVISESSTNGNWAKVKWDGNWITFLDSMAQTNILLVNNRSTVLPTYYRRVTIDPLKHNYNESFVEIHFDQHLFTKYCSSFVMEGFVGLSLSERIEKPPILASMHFSPYYEKLREGRNIEVYNEIENSYAITQFLHFYRHLKTCDKDIPSHFLRIKDMLRGYDKKIPNKKSLNKYLKHPNSVNLRFIKYLYKKPEKLIRNTEKHIAGFEEYDDLYNRDLADTLFHSDYFIREMLNIVQENLNSQNSIHICEVGPVTGLFSRKVLTNLRSINDRYVITDFDDSYFDRIKNELSNFSMVTDYQIWDFTRTHHEKTYDLVITGQTFNTNSELMQALQNIRKSLKDGGFLLLNIENANLASILCTWGLRKKFWNYWDVDGQDVGLNLSQENWNNLLQDSGFDIVAIKETYKQKMILCRKTYNKKSIHQRLQFNKDDLKTCQDYYNALNDNTNKRLWLMGNSASAPGLTGLVRSLRKEPNGDRVRCLFVDDSNKVSKRQISKVLKHDLATNVFKNGIWGSYQYRELPETDMVETDSAYMQVMTKGDFSSMRWISAPDLCHESDVYDVNYCALNFKDIMLASGKLPAESGGTYHDCPGMEFSGIRNRDGQRVMGIAVKALSTKVILQRKVDRAWKVPESWTLEEAATVPLVYLTVYLGLIIRAGMKQGQKVLIHSGSGGIGIAAINLALSMQCEVFTTVGSEEKRKYIKKKFPQIDDDHIGYSRDTSFEKLVFQQTNGHGVDIVLNSLSGELMLASLRVLAMNGHFVEIGKFDRIQDTPLGMSIFLKDISIHGVDLSSTILHNPDETKRLLQLFDKGIKSGVIKPLDRTIFDYDEVEDAFRYMARAKHIGKVLIRIRDENNRDKIKVLAKPKFSCDSKKIYIITGGLGGFGLELAYWLVLRGAKNLVLTSRRGIKNGYQASKIDKMQNLGANVTISKRNVTNYRSTLHLIKQCEKIAPIGGIFHLAMVMSDALFLNQDKHTFEKVCSVKLNGAENLSKVSSEYCKKLDQFVCFSSIVATEGNEGQTNYAFANAAMDRLCEQRKRNGLPAISIQWGPIGDVGFIQKNAYVNLSNTLLGLQSIHSCIENLDILLSQDETVVTSFTLDLHRHKEFANNSKKTSTDLVNVILHIFGFQNESQVDMDTPLFELGMDSLMTVEILIALEYGFNLKMNMAEIRKSTINQLKQNFSNNTNTT